MTNLIEQEFVVDPSKVISAVEYQFGSHKTKSWKDLSDFWKLLKQVITVKLDLEGKSKEVIVTEELPSDMKVAKQWREIITFSIGCRKPGSTEGGPPTDSDSVRRQFYPMEIECSINDPAAPGYSLTRFEQPIDNFVVLTCWALTNAEADQRAFWLENLISDFRGYFKASGVKELLWLGQSANLSVAPFEGGDIFHGRPIHLYLRTEKIWVVSQKTLEEVIIVVEADFNGGE